jgi:hypothetical protein
MEDLTNRLTSRNSAARLAGERAKRICTATRHSSQTLSDGVRRIPADEIAVKLTTNPEVLATDGLEPVFLLKRNGSRFPLPNCEPSRAGADRTCFGAKAGQ